MLQKITQLFKERFKQIRGMNVRQVMETDLFKSFLIILAVTLLSYEATDLFYNIIRFPLTKEISVSAGKNISSAADNRPIRLLQDYDIIIGRNLFRSTLKTFIGNEEGGLSGSDQKTIDLDLKGTVACNSSFGFAVIEESGRKQKLYKMGDKIGPYRLTRITRNTALLKSSEGEITLKIKETVQGSLLPNKPAGERDGASPRFNLNREEVNERLNNLGAVMNQAVIRPFMTRGVQEGYLITNIAHDSLYEKIGLQNGDIIVDVNNNQMQSANDLLQVLNSIQAGSSLSLNIRRRGKNESINYSIE